MICNDFEQCIEAYKGNNSERCYKCRIESKDSNISCSEKGRRYNLQNDGKFRVINFLIDGGVFVDENKANKCDRLYLVDDPTHPTVIFIELKGKNVLHGLEQIHDTIERYKKTFGQSRKVFRIVCSGAPKIGNDKRVIKLKKFLYKSYGTLPKISENVIDEKYSKL